MPVSQAESGAIGKYILLGVSSTKSGGRTIFDQVMIGIIHRVDRDKNEPGEGANGMSPGFVILAAKEKTADRRLELGVD